MSKSSHKALTNHLGEDRSAPCDPSVGQSVEKELLARLKLALTASKVGVWEYDLRNSSLIWDTHMYELYGVKAEDFPAVYEAWEQGLHPDDKLRGQREIEDAISGKQKFDTEFRVVWPNGNVRHIRALADVIKDVHDIPIKMIGVNWDITESKLQQAALNEAKERAEISSKAKEEFLANMSHEIRTPLNGLLGCLTLLSESSLSDEQKDLLHTAEQSGQMLLNIINDILDFSKIDTGNLELEILPFDWSDTIGQCIDLYQSTAEKNNTSIELSNHIDSSVQYLGDSTRIRQVICNLISNAVKFTIGGKIRVNCIESCLEDRSAKVLTVSVMDTGIGIEKAKQEKLFKAFSQADSSITRRYGGTGLGLSICKNLIHAMNGNIWVKSEKDKGSEFGFSIPIKTVEKKKEYRPNKEQLANQSKDQFRLLLAEDNRVNQKIIQLMLQKLGYHCDIASNGQEALNMVTSVDYDLVFMDMQMPVMGGIEATAKIVELLGERHPPIIALTANVLVTDREKCLAAGMSDFMGKPVKKSELKKKLELFLHTAPHHTKVSA
ncbi:MAG: response regulator [Pseudobacteriovorax sp.]|nr:response regulator [Pseudobacteriovorax sp.]